jgi:nucleotide-binding universal stress UspA family protein
MEAAMFAMKRILTPVDFSQRSIGAARYAEALAERFGAEVVLLHVLPPPHYEFSSMEVGGAVLTELFEARSAQVKAELDSFAVEQLPRLNARRVLIEGDPARRIVQYAQDEKVDLIVVPTHGYGPFRRFILGSVTAKILHDADFPVWTGVHLEEAPGVEKIDFKTVLAALDLGPESEKTLAWAANFAAAVNARLVVCHVTLSIEGRSGEYFDPDWREHLAAEAAAEIKKLLEQVPAKPEILIESGDTPKVVCSVAERLGADVLVIGRGSAAGVFGRLRANAYSIIRQSPCPVVSV